MSFSDFCTPKVLICGIVHCFVLTFLTRLTNCFDPKHVLKTQGTESFKTELKLLLTEVFLSVPQGLLLPERLHEVFV